MLGYLRGTFQGQPDGAGGPILLDVGGIGFEVIVPPSVEREILETSQPDSPLFLYVSPVSSRDQPWPTLFGFRRPEERAFWELLRSVPRLGGKGAARAMAVPFAEIARAIQEGNRSFLDSLPGVTLEGADRIIAALRKKVGPFLMERPTPAAARRGPLTPQDEMRQDAVDLLVSMGVKRPDAQRGVETLLATRPDLVTVQDLLTEYFRGYRGARDA